MDYKESFKYMRLVVIVILTISMCALFARCFLF